jgi:hypothetical protein
LLPHHFSLGDVQQPTAAAGDQQLKASSALLLLLAGWLLAFMHLLLQLQGKMGRRCHSSAAASHCHNWTLGRRLKTAHDSSSGLKI